MVLTKYVHIKSTTVYAPRRNWDSPNPFLASECSPPPPETGGRWHTSLREGGWGKSQFRRGAYTVVLFICTYFVVVLLDMMHVCTIIYLLEICYIETFPICSSSLFNRLVSGANIWVVYLYCSDTFYSAG